VYRAAALANLTAQGCAEFVELGIRTVIDLRVATERAIAPEAACVQEAADVVVAPLPVPYSVSPDDYIADLNATESVALAFTALGDEAAYPIYFHCTYGRDRSGVLAAIILLALGAAREDVIAEYQLTLEAGLTTYPLSLEAVFDEIDRRGGVEAYLAGAGVTTDQLATLRAQAIAP
jgi:protein-tyrosine phosphatase